MSHVFLFVNLWILAASATPIASVPPTVVGRPACGTMLMPSSPARPDPFTVDPQDVTAILIFVQSVTPFPSDATPWAMQQGLTAFWRVYRPDLTDRDLAERLSAFESSVYALQVIRRSHRMALSDKGRLRLTWLKFLADVADPANAPFDPRLEERASSLMHRRSPNPILARLKILVDPSLDKSVAAVVRAVQTLWARDFQTAVPDFTRELEMPWTTGVPAVWNTYVDALGAMGADPRASYRPVKRLSKHALAELGDMHSVQLDAKVIGAFLLTRYPEIQIRQNALNRMFARLREDFELAPRTDGFRTSDLHMILYDGRNFDVPAGRLVNAWTRLLGELEQRDRVLDAAE